MGSEDFSRVLASLLDVGDRQVQMGVIVVLDEGDEVES